MTNNLTAEEISEQIRCVSHEIRNHLSVCDMYSQIIKKNMEKSGFQNDSVSNAVECIRQSVQIIGSNLLDLKSLNNETSKICDFQSVVLKGIELGKVYAFDKDIEFGVFVKNSDNILIDENRFLSCIVNIIKNAAEAIDLKGKIEIFGEVKNKICYLKIANNGKPIPKDKFDKIFEKGYTSKKSGCGLGLAICKNFLEAQGASVELKDSTKSHTVFEIRIPAVK